MKQGALVLDSFANHFVHYVMKEVKHNTFLFSLLSSLWPKGWCAVSSIATLTPLSVVTEGSMPCTYQLFFIYSNFLD